MKTIVRRDVPILDEHDLKDDDGKLLIHIDAKKLKEIADRNNKRIKETGDLIPLVIGHTRDGEPEDKQPELVGYAKDLQVKPFKKTGRKALVAKFLIFKHKLHKARDFPRRSIELWLNDLKVDPISLLGATTPERDLGLLQLQKAGSRIRYAANGKRKYWREIDDNETPNEKPMNEKAIIEGVLKALEESAVWKWAESKMREDEEQDDLTEDTEGLDIPPEEEGEELPEDMDSPQSADSPEDEEEEDLEDEPVRYSAGASAPSGANTYTPSFGTSNRSTPQMKKKSGVDNKMTKKGKVPFSRQGDNDRLHRFQKSLAQSRKENASLRIKFQRLERERDLMELAAQGYEFDPAEELDYCSQLPEDHYKYHLGRIKKRYQRSPVGDFRFDMAYARSSPEGHTPERTAEQSKRAIALACSKGISYEEALAQLGD